MAYTTLPAERLKAACERAATKVADSGRGEIVALLHLSSAALSINAAASVTVTKEEFMLLAPHW